MSNSALSPSWITRHFLVLLIVCTLGAAGLGWATLAFGTTQQFEALGLSTASRTLNQLTAVVLTCMALILPLTANLYTPKLVRVYVTHPLIVTGLSVLMLSQLLVMTATFFPADHRWARHLVHLVAIGYFLVITALLPFLFGISQFLRPSYFIPLLTRRGVQDLNRLNRAGVRAEATRHLFETIDVLTNIALSGMARGDRQVVLLSLESMHTLLMEIIASGGAKPHSTWRTGQQHFVPGLALEGQAFLVREGTWPEAYVLAQFMKVMEAATHRQHEILAELASRLGSAAQLASALGREGVVELHVMAFNTLMRNAIEEKDLRRLQNVSYQYRLLIGAFAQQPERLRSSTHHLLHYGELATRLGLPFGQESVIYDLGDLLLTVARQDENQALELFGGLVVPHLRRAMGHGEPATKIVLRTLIRLHWEARAVALQQLPEAVRAAFFPGDAEHRELLERVLGENRELHFEFNDRLMRFAFLSPAAEALARPFLAT